MSGSSLPNRHRPQDGRRHSVSLGGPINELIGDLSADLTAHMQKEESVLFPAIRAIAAGGGDTASIRVPIWVMDARRCARSELRTLAFRPVVAAAGRETLEFLRTSVWPRHDRSLDAVATANAKRRGKLGL